MPDSGSGPVVSEAMARKPPFIENSDEGIPLMFTESHVRVATPEESILWERLQAALSVDRERDRTDQRDKNLPNSLDAENGYLLRRVKELEAERDRLVEERSYPATPVDCLLSTLSELQAVPPNTVGAAIRHVMEAVAECRAGLRE